MQFENEVQNQKERSDAEKQVAYVEHVRKLKSSASCNRHFLQKCEHQWVRVYVMFIN